MIVADLDFARQDEVRATLPALARTGVPTSTTGSRRHRV